MPPAFVMEMIGSIGYWMAAAAYGGLALLLFAGWKREGPEGFRLIVATVATTVWATTLAVDAADLRLSRSAVTIAEALRYAAWLLAVIALARPVTSSAMQRCARLYAVAFPLVAVLVAVLAAAGYDAGMGDALLIRGALVGALLGLVLLEQVYRNASGSARVAVSPLVLGVGGLFAYDLFLYSQAELLRGLSPVAWEARGYVNALFVPFLAIAARRNPHWSLDVFVSRQAVFFSTTLVAAGLYLALMAAGGYAVRALGGTWGGAAQVVFVVGAGAVLVSLLMSVPLRRRVRVYLSKHFFRNKYDYRLEWLRFVRTIAAADPSRALDAAVEAAAQIFDSPRAVLLAVPSSGDPLRIAGCWPADASAPLQNPLLATDSLVAFLRSTRWIVDVREYRADPKLYQGTPLPAWLQDDQHWRFVSPVFEGERMTGVLLLAAPPPPFSLGYEDRDLLEIVGRHIASLVSQAEASARLLEVRQFEAYNRLTSFMMHDLKNAAAQLSLVVRNAERHRDKPEFIDDAIGTISGSAERITRLIEQFKAGTDAGSLRPVPLRPIVDAAVERGRLHSPAPTVGTLDDGIVVRADPDRLGAVIDHVIRNAQESTDGSGRVEVSLHAQSGGAVIVVSDDGVGMDADFVRDRLFRPFDSTKGTKGMGIGAYQVREYVRELGGDVEVNSALGRGTWFALSIPVHATGTQAAAVLEP